MSRRRTRPQLTPEDRKPRVLLHLDHGRSLETWQRKFESGVVGDPAPYGYYYAADYVELAYSADHPESKLLRFLRRGIAYTLGFDILHAWRNRCALADAEVIWTHTEHEHLAVGLLVRLGLVPPVNLVAQSVWLWDSWSSMSGWRRGLYRWLLAPASIHTTLSPDNAAFGSSVLGEPVLAVPFGIDPREMLEPTANPGPVVRVVAPGNDRHRDWSTLREVARSTSRLDVVVLSHRRRARRLVDAAVPNFRVESPSSRPEVLEAFRSAHVVAVPLSPNMHASGITVALEALTMSRALVITDVGGVRYYFGDAALYAAVGDPVSLRQAVETAADERIGEETLAGAREQVYVRGITERDYGLRHVALTALLAATSCEQKARYKRVATAFEAVPEDSLPRPTSGRNAPNRVDPTPDRWSRTPRTFGSCPDGLRA
jgi:glycosyltransferase involved in cell wall biosynthesis